MKKFRIIFTFVQPPIEDIKIKATEQIGEEEKLEIFPFIDVNQLMILNFVGVAIVMVEDIKYN